MVVGDDVWEEQKSSRSAGEAILVGKSGPMPRTAKLHRLSIAIAEPLHSGISLIYGCAEDNEMHESPSIGAKRSF